MNKNEKLIVGFLVAALAATLGWQYFAPKPAPQPVPVQQVQTPAVPAQAPAVPAAPAAPVIAPASQELYTLANDQVKLTFSNVGACLQKAELLNYRSVNKESAPCVTLKTGDLLNLAIPGAPAYLTYRVTPQGNNALVFEAALPDAVTLTRTVTLEPDYVLTVSDAFVSPTGTALAPYRFSAGLFTPQDEAGDLVTFDLLAAGETKPEYYETKLGKMLGARSAFLGCGTSTDPTGVPVSRTETFAAAQTWVALKNRFFVSLVMPQTASPAEVTITRDALSRKLHINQLTAAFTYPAVQLQGGVPHTVTTRLFLGPKKVSDLDAFGAHAERVMDFGFFAWFGYLMLKLLNFFHLLIPNYGVAIILLTIFVRIVFWPLTHKSTVAMRKMSVIQPQIKALQQQFKDQPQKIQQETFKLYREHKVNPFSSCLPMLVQIPIFIALFVVLRASIELRFASFLWIADLSQPENLFAGILPVPLNILPILTAVTMGLQTHLSPSSGDPAQKKMMTWMMPIMLLFMFYNMASALCLYWTVSQVLSIAQTWWIQRSAAKEAALAQK